MKHIKIYFAIIIIMMQSCSSPLDHNRSICSDAIIEERVCLGMPIDSDTKSRAVIVDIGEYFEYDDLLIINADEYDLEIAISDNVVKKYNISFNTYAINVKTDSLINKYNMSLNSSKEMKMGNSGKILEYRGDFDGAVQLIEFEDGRRVVSVYM